MTKRNGTIWRVISVVITIAIIVVGTIYKEMKIDVGKNTEHRLQDEVDTLYIKEKISNIEKVQRQILTAVQNN